ncbi:MAG: chaperone modulator CbpM [Bacillota bacterium]
MKLIRIHCHSETEEKLSIYQLDLRPALLETLAELGILEIEEGLITPAELQRAYKALRLRNCLGVNWIGASVILDLLDRMEAMQEEINRLRKGR